MTIYSDAAYAPKFQIGQGSPWEFSDAPQANILDMHVEEGRRVSNHVIPGRDGSLIIGSKKDGIQISLEIEIATEILSEYRTRRSDLEDILEGGDDGTFDFYLRYVDSDNYWVYTNCAVENISLLEGAQDPTNPNTVAKARITLGLSSADAVPTIISEGVTQVGDETLTADGTTISAVTFLITDELIVQNEFGDIKFKISAATSRMEVVGTITQDL